MSRHRDQDFIDLTQISDEESPQKPRQRKAKKKRAPVSDSDEDYAGSPGLAAAAPNPKVKAKQEKKASQEKEKRIDSHFKPARWASKPSIKVKERIARALPGSAHRLFLIDKKPTAGKSHEFTVLGATGSVYTVTIGRSPHCTCPDHAKGNVCKHLLFVMIRVLRLSPDDPLVWQRGLLSDEVQKVLERSAAEVDAGVKAGDDVVNRWRAIGGGSQAEAAVGPVVREIKEGDECPICQDELRAGATSAAERCQHCVSCGNAAHEDCMQKWKTARMAQSLEVTCPFCRGNWEEGAVAAAGGSGAGQQYVNLGGPDGHVPSLEQLYGDRAVWIRAGQGEIGRRQAAAQWNASQDYF